MSVDTVLAACLVGLLLLGVLGGYLSYDDKRARKRHAERVWLREMTDLARRAEIAEADRATLREHLNAASRANLSGDLSQVLAILDGPARDDDRVKVARDRLDDIRRAL